MCTLTTASVLIPASGLSVATYDYTQYNTKAFTDAMFRASNLDLTDQRANK
ncbi:MAG: hypothetical protein ACOVS5_16060 [Oligoflexus sp.]